MLDFTELKKNLLHYNISCWQKYKERQMPSSIKFTPFQRTVKLLCFYSLADGKAISLLLE